MTPSLMDVLDSAYACLAEGAADPGSAWRTPTLANVDATGNPSLRSVVLRGWAPATRCLDIHTDTRSAKHAALQRDPRAALHGWDPVRRVQLRVKARVRLHAGDAVAAASWAMLPPASRATYSVVPGPGHALPHPHATTQDADAAGYRVFCVMSLVVDELEWLRLEQGSYARARFCWDNGTLASIWLVP